VLFTRIILAFVFLFAALAPYELSAQEPVPGDSCAGYPDGAYMRSGGPELSGATHHLLCVNSDWLAVDPGNRCPTEGLVAWYPLNEGSGTTAGDASGNNLDGSLVDMEGDEWTSGLLNDALDFNNTDDIVVITNSASLEGFTELTLSAWVYPTAPGPGFSGRVISKSDGGSGDDYTLRYSNSGNNHAANFRITTTGGSVTLHADTQIPQNTWSHIAGTWDGSELRVYFNGNSDATPVAQSGTIETNGRDLSLGLHLDSPTDREFPGRIDEARIYDRALSASEIAALYNSGAGCI